MKGLKANVPVLLYLGKILLDKIGRKGVRINGGFVRVNGRWKQHVHVTPYAEPCMCFDCQPVVKGLPA